jgi:uncharacterized membrane protein YqiK
MDLVHNFTLFWWVIPLLLLAALYKLVLRLAFGAVIVPQDRIAVVTKKYALLGAHRTLPDGKIIALKDEAGIQADTLGPGLHWGLWPWQYQTHMEEFTTIPEGKIGVVEARDGVPISGGRVLGRKVDCDSFQDARAFLSNHGERGPQIDVIPPGTYRINTALFHVVTEPATEIKDNRVGVITTKDGVALPKGDIAGKDVPGHSQFQDGQAFLDHGGYRGLQEQVILAGRYYINPRFATVEVVPMTEVPIAHVGVVIAYVGEAGVDVTGTEFKHGNLVSRGQKGVWVDTLDPGKYPINPYTHKVEAVSTANIVLNWANDKSEAHRLDANLCTITVRSEDGFTFNLDVSQIIHIPGTDAPKVIARFGSVANLVTQVLEPIIGNYFRRAAQTSDVIGFLAKRSERQDEARESITEALAEYNVVAVDTLIGDITPPAELMKTLTDRKLAQQQKTTYDTQRLAEDTRKELEQAKALAATQARVVDAERSVQIADFTAQAAVKTAEGDAKSKTINAEADANVLITVGNAEAGKTQAIGTAEAEVIQRKIASMESGNYAAIEVARALAASGFKLVPDIVAGGNGADGGSSLVNVLLATLVRDGVAKRAGALGMNASA